MTITVHFNNGQVLGFEGTGWRHIDENGDGWIILSDKGEEVWVSPHNVLWIEKK